MNLILVLADGFYMLRVRVQSVFVGLTTFSFMDSGFDGFCV